MFETLVKSMTVMKRQRSSIKRITLKNKSENKSDTQAQILRGFFYTRNSTYKLKSKINDRFDEIGRGKSKGK